MYFVLSIFYLYCHDNFVMGLFSYWNNFTLTISACNLLWGLNIDLPMDCRKVCIRFPQSNLFEGVDTRQGEAIMPVTLRLELKTPQTLLITFGG